MTNFLNVKSLNFEESCGISLSNSLNLSIFVLEVFFDSNFRRFLARIAEFLS